jgi:DNA/RNA endonuclease G (NUC1)
MAESDMHQDMIASVFPETSKTEQILYLPKSEWDVYYSTRNKWPYLIIQQLGPQTGTTQPGQDFVQRENRPDPFMPDPAIPAEYSLTLADYENYKKYGGSPGHNAPAAHHKTSIPINNETYLFSNITPQEIVFNAGSWVILENWVKVVAKNPMLTQTFCITGSIPASVDSQFGTSQINVPTHMYKILFTRAKPDRVPPNISKFATSTLYVACFLYPNIPINPIPKNTDIWRYMITLDELSAKTGINYLPIFRAKTGFNPGDHGTRAKTGFNPAPPGNQRLMNLSKLFPIRFNISDDLQVQMAKALMYGALIYSADMSDLEYAWAKVQTLEPKFRNLKFHREYYELANERIAVGEQVHIPHMDDPGLFLTRIESTARSTAGST